MNHLNVQYDGGSPNLPLPVGDRYYAQDMARDLWYYHEMANTTWEKRLASIPAIVSGGCVRQQTGTTIIVSPVRAIVRKSVQFPSNYISLPPAVGTAKIPIFVEITAQITINVAATYTPGGATNYVKLRSKSAPGATRTRAYLPGSYVYEVSEGYDIVVDTVVNTDEDALLATFTEAGGVFTFSQVNNRTIRLSGGAEEEGIFLDVPRLAFSVGKTFHSCEKRTITQATDGIIFAKGFLWFRNGNIFYKYDPNDFRLVATVTGTALGSARSNIGGAGFCNRMAFDGQYIWSGVEQAVGTTPWKIDLIDVDALTVTNITAPFNGVFTAVAASQDQISFAWDGCVSWCAVRSLATLPAITRAGVTVATGTGLTATNQKAILFSGKYVFIQDYTGVNLFKYNLTGGAPSILAITTPIGAIAQAGNYLATVQGNGGNPIAFVDMETLTIIHTAAPALGAAPQSLVFDGRYLWAGVSGGTVNNIHVGTGIVSAAAVAAAIPQFLHTASDGRYLYAANGGVCTKVVQG